MNTCFDALIVGGGLVGASLALALARQGRQVALIEGQQPPLTELDRPDDWDPRVYAISPANQAFLQGLHAWPDASRLGVVAGMDVRGDRHGRIAFHAADAGQPALAWIAENRWLLAALWQQLADSPAQCIAGVRPSAISQHPRHVSLTLDDGRSLNTRLLIGADGANSWVRQQTGIRVDVSPYGHSGVVANFVAERDHGNIARQWFLGDGILAWLPLPGQRISMVWSTAKPEALTALDAATLCDTVAQAGGRELGGFSLLTPAHAFPLRLMRPDSVVAPRIALVGDAAHTVHPLAGQGVNLGFGDAQALAALLAEHGGDPGEWLLLRRYQRMRREAVNTMQLTCDGLFKLFHTQDPLLGWLRNTGLSLTQHLPLIKRQLAKQAIGF